MSLFSFEGCDGGYYCASAGLSKVTDQCKEGYYCSRNASVNNPTDKTTGDICPIGHYCPRGSDRPWPCQNGTYMNQTGIKLHEKLSRHRKHRNKFGRELLSPRNVSAVS